MNEAAAGLPAARRESVQERRREGRPRSVAALVAIGLTGLVVFCGFVALGVWQIERRAWKLDLIARVEARLHAEPIAAPGPAEWTAVSAERDEYVRVKLDGVFVPGEETFTQAVTEIGPGFWALAPFRTREGFTVLVNRGFVPRDRRADAQAPAGDQSIIGLVRMTEPKGGFLRENDPSAGLWRSRDVAAIAEAHGLGRIAPYFVDADATPNPGGWPVGGLTVVSFNNNHLIYALTWFGLAIMVAGGAAIVARRELALHRGRS